jgi:hypothetical protein
VFMVAAAVSLREADAEPAPAVGAGRTGAAASPSGPPLRAGVPAGERGGGVRPA